MFGHDKDEDNKKNNENLIHPVNNKPVDERLMGVAEESKDKAEEVISEEAQSSTDKDIEEIVNGINDNSLSDDNSSGSAVSSDDVDDVDDDKSKEDDVVPHLEPTPTSDDNEPSGELMDIKKSALEELSPLIDQLDQTPEEKTNTLLMMIQATDDQSHIPDAFKAAKDIKDDKKRAQAMLDIINEINYFTNKK